MKQPRQSRYWGTTRTSPRLPTQRATRNIASSSLKECIYPGPTYPNLSMCPVKTQDPPPLLSEYQLLAHRSDTIIPRNGMRLTMHSLKSYVIVPGVYGSWEDGAEAGPGSASSSWASAYVKDTGYSNRILKFEYTAQHLFSGPRCREAIRTCALQLLRGVSALRKDSMRVGQPPFSVETPLTWKQKRLVTFISFDLGGIIVKDALVAASLDPSSWSDITDMSRVLVFADCPHRSTSQFDMEDRLCRFLFSSSGRNTPIFTPSASSIAGLAAAVTEVNGLFVDSKATLRSRLVSLHAGPPPSGVEDDAQEGINQAFDSYGGTLGVPFEKRFVLASSDASKITQYLGELNSVLDIAYDDEIAMFERKLLSRASPIVPFRSAEDRNAPATETSAYKTWLDLPGPQILYIHGSHGVREAAEQVFYALDERKAEESTIVLYFSFDQWDVRRDSIRDMASTFLTQIICQFPHNEVWTRSFSNQLDFERGWTEADLIYWLERFRFNDQFEQAIYVINYFDECTKGSRKAFLDKFKYLAAASEGQWKVVVTSHKPGVLLGELGDTALTTLDLSASSNLPSSGPNLEENLRRLTQARPELLLQGGLARKELSEIAEIDPLARQVIFEQARAQPEWPHSLSIRKLFEPLELMQNGQWDDRAFASLLDHLVRRIPGEAASLRVVFSWLLYTVRPLTVWELGTALYLGSDLDKGLASPPLSMLEDLIRKIQLWFAGIVEVDQNEVRISHPRLRNILMGKGSFSDKEGEKESLTRYLWDNIADTAHYDIARLSLDYLSRPGVRDIIDGTCRDPETSGARIFTDRGNLCSYVLQAWTHHFLHSSSAEQTKLAAQFSSSPLGQDWARGHWALSNPVTRSKVALDSPFPIFAGLGLYEVVKPRDAQDLSRGLLEAASKGQSQTVRRLLKHKFPEATLLDALVAAGASGEEQLMLDLIHHISSKSDDPDSVAWPPSLIYRASWLGLDRAAERLLQLGVSPDPDVPWLGVVRLSPLCQAARNFHTATTRALLRHGADVAFRSRYNRTPLHLAALLGSVEISRILVQEGKSDLEAKDERSLTPLYFPSLYGHYGTVKELLKLGADPNMGLKTDSTVDRWTPLVVAADNGFEKCLKILVENGAEVNLDGPTDEGTALRHAAIKSHVKICRILLEAGADPNSPLITPPLIVQLPMYVGEDKEEPRQRILELLLENGVNVNAKDPDGVTTIVRLLGWSNIDHFFELVLDHVADIHILDSDGRGLLYHAVLKQQLALVKLLIARGAKVNQIANDGVPPIYNAIPQPETVRALLEGGANPSLGNSSGFTSLMFAAWFKDNLESLKLILEHNVALEDQFDQEGTSHGWTALTCAAAEGYAAAVRLLAEAGANLRHLAEDGIPILHFAAKSSVESTEKIAALLEFLARLDLNQTDKEGRTALHLADVDLPNITRLVNIGANVNIQDKEGYTPLSNFASSNTPDKVKFLLRHGADPNIVSPYYGGPLHRAAQNSNLEMVKLLVENESATVDVNLPSSGMASSPLIATCLHQDHDDTDPLDQCSEIVRYLIDHGADINAHSGKLGYALNAAALSSGPAIFDLLREKGARIDVKDHTGRTPAHLAAYYSANILQKVVDAGGDIAARDVNGRTPLMWAAQSGRVDVTEKILAMKSLDGGIDAKDRDGWTALCWAARGPTGWDIERPVSELASVIKILLEHGADKSVVAATADGRKWTPLKIARYHGAQAEKVELLKGEDPSDDDESKVATTHDSVCCDACLSVSFSLVAPFMLQTDVSNERSSADCTDKTHRTSSGLSTYVKRAHIPPFVSNAIHTGTSYTCRRATNLRAKGSSTRG